MKKLLTNQEFEVEWYKKNGKYPERIAKCREGKEYVIGDWAWHIKFPHLEEYIEPPRRGKT